MDNQKETEQFDLEACLKKAIELNISDIHLRAGERPVFRHNGKMLRQDGPILKEEDLEIITNLILPRGLRNKSAYAYDLDFSYELDNLARFRVNLCRQMGKTALVLRIIPTFLKTLSDLSLPQQLARFIDFANGIVLITGPTGSGKSTTLASLINLINTKYNNHVITIEDPVEFVHKNKNSIITQRQVGVDTETFQSGVKYALRQDPDVILIGEIRDRETVEAALQAAETGHLVFATLHTNDAISTVNRLINFFEPPVREYIRQQVANNLRATLSQRLLTRQDKAGKIPACEIMLVTPTVEDLIKKDQLEAIYDLLKHGQFMDMLTLNYSLNLLCSEKIINPKDAIAVSNRPLELQQMLKGVYQGSGS